MTRRALIAVTLVALTAVVLTVLWAWGGAEDGVPAQWSTAAPSASASSSAASSQAPAPAVTAEPPPAPAADLATSATLSIPGIGLRHGVHSEGLREGKINPPAGSVMWFTGFDRVAPGEVGTSVIAGHVVAGGRSDVFADLAEVTVGDQVEVTGADGGTSRFEVVRAGVVDKDELTVDQAVWGPNTSVPRLAIITCDDAYGFRDDGHRVANFVVIAEPA